MEGRGVGGEERGGKGIGWKGLDWVELGFVGLGWEEGGVGRVWIGTRSDRIGSEQIGWVCVVLVAGICC